MELTPPKKLNNGLSVLINPARHLHSVGVAIGIDYGSIYEGRDVSGSAHILEHMPFEGTSKRSVSDIRREFLWNKDGFSAGTGRESTIFYFQSEPGHAKTAVSMLADMVQNAVVDKKELDEERGPILNELLKAKDDPEEYTGDKIYSLVFRNQPAGRLVIGTKQVIKNISRERVLDIYHKYYTPRAMTVSIYGNISKEAAMNLVRDNFEEFDRPYTQLADDDSPGPSKHMEFIEERPKIDFLRSLTAFGFSGSRTMLRNHPKDIATIPLLETILGERVKNTIREKLSLPDCTDAQYDLGRTYGMIAIGYGGLPSKYRNAKKCIARVVDDLSNGEITNEELEQAKCIYLSDWEGALDDPLFMSFSLADMYTINSFQPDKLCEIMSKELSLDDMRSAANRYLNNDKSTVFTLKPKGEKYGV